MVFDPNAVKSKLGEVGNNHIKTGNKLIHSATEVRTVATALDDDERIATSLGTIETGTRSTRDLLTPVAASLHSVASGLSSITVPSIEFERRELDFGALGRYRVITSISISSTRPLRGIGTNIESVADDLDNVRTALRDIAAATGILQDELPQIRTRLASGADDLEAAGKELVAAGTAIQDVGMLFIQ